MTKNLQNLKFNFALNFSSFTSVGRRSFKKGNTVPSFSQQNTILLSFMTLPDIHKTQAGTLFLFHKKA
jgi:hypothetical protein